MGFFNFFKKEVPKPKPTVPAVKTLFSKPGAITAIGLIVEPGCL